MKKAAPFLLLITALLAIKLPWMVLQVVAWGCMAGDNFRQTGSVTETFRLTFNPEYRCVICKSIDAAQGEEHRQENNLPANDIVLLLPNLATIRLPDIPHHQPDTSAVGIPGQWIGGSATPPPKSC